jgi:hypothetical protein
MVFIETDGSGAETILGLIMDAFATHTDIFGALQVIRSTFCPVFFELVRWAS